MSINRVAGCGIPDGGNKVTQVFLKENGEIVHSATFMKGPNPGKGKVWSRSLNNIWSEEDSSHGPESSPNHRSYELHIFGEHYATFMRRQYT